MRVRGCGFFFDFFWDLSFRLKLDIDVMVQPHLKMFRMCVRHLPHDWDTTAFALVFVSEGWLSVSSTPPFEHLCFPSSFLGMVLLSFASFLRERIDRLHFLVVPLSSLSFEWHPTCIVHVGCGSLVPLPRLCVALSRSTVRSFHDLCRSVGVRVALVDSDLRGVLGHHDRQMQVCLTMLVAELRHVPACHTKRSRLRV